MFFALGGLFAVLRVVLGVAGVDIGAEAFAADSGPFTWAHLLDTAAGCSIAIGVLQLRFGLATKIVLGLVLGLAFGFYAKFAELDASVIKPVGEMFLKLITMIVVPLVFASLLSGVASLGDVGKLARFGSKTIAYYIVTTCIAVTIGLVAANLFKPGADLDTSVRDDIATRYQAEASAKMEGSAEGQAAKAEADKPAEPKATGFGGILAQLGKRFVSTMVDIVPKNPASAIVEGRMLQVIFFALFLGICLTLIPHERARPLIDLFESLSEAMLKMVMIVMAIAPYGVFALIASVVSQFGTDVLSALLSYSLVVIGALLVHMLVVYPLAVMLFARRSPARFLRGIAPAWSVAFSTSSSNATLPVTMRVVERRLGVPERVGSFTLPLGATINMDGTALYQGVAAFFIFQVYGLPLSIADQLTIVMTATLASIGTAGVPGVGLIMLILVLQSVGLGADKIAVGIALILGVDRILDMCRTVVNVTGDASCAVVVASTEGVLGEGQLTGEGVTEPLDETPNPA